MSHNYVDRAGRQGVFLLPVPIVVRYPLSPRVWTVPFYLPFRPILRRLVITAVLVAAVFASHPFPALAEDGGQLYSRLCASCHRPLERSTVRGVSVPRIRSVLRYVPSMRKLGRVTEQEISAIVDALKAVRSDRAAKGER